MKYLTILMLIISSQLSALPDMKNHGHKDVMVEDRVMHTSKEWIDLTACTKGENFYLYGWCEDTKSRIWIGDIDGGVTCVVQDPETGFTCSENAVCAEKGGVDIWYLWFKKDGKAIGRVFAATSKDCKIALFQTYDKGCE